MQADLPRRLRVLLVVEAAFSEGEAANPEFMIDSFLHVSSLSKYDDSQSR
jgi:hypothetical protein